MSSNSYAAGVGWPRMWLATVITAVVAFGLPVLFLVIDPGANGSPIEAGVAQAVSPTVSYQAPSGWVDQDNPQGTVITKGGATIEIVTKPFDGSATDLYRDFVDQLAAATTVSSSTDPAPSQLSGLEAVEGTIHFILDGTDNTSFLVAGTGSGEGMTVSFFGPLSALQPLQSEYESILASVRLNG